MHFLISTLKPTKLNNNSTNQPINLTTYQPTNQLIKLYSQTYESKLAELLKASESVEGRVHAYQELPLAIESLHEILNYSRTFYANMSNHTVGDNDRPGSKPFTLVERKKLRNLNKDTIVSTRL